MKDTNYYDRASTSYSATRYPAHARTYVQFFFKKRLDVVLSFVRAQVGSRTDLSILEIGCADGVVMRAIYDAFPEAFSVLEAVDLSPGMIEVARELHKDTPIHFEERAKLSPRKYDIVIEVGVLNYTPFADDLAVISNLLMSDGCAIISIAGSDSLKNILAPDRGYLHLSSYAEYEKEMNAHFHIKDASSVGFVIPLLWRMPMVGRLLQPALERMFSDQNQDWFHEKVYMLKANPIS